MNKQRINEVIAEELAKRGGIRCEVLAPDWMEYQPKDLCTRNLRAFTHSLDSCRLFEETLSEEDWRRYIFIRWDVIAKAYLGSDEISWPSEGAFIILEKQTVAERCEAYLRTIGKWEE